MTSDVVLPYSAPPTQSGAIRLLYDARESAVAGDSQHAYTLALKATQIYPQHVDAWLMRSELAQSAEETVICLNRVNTLNPNHPIAMQKSYLILQNMLKADPYLQYQTETDELYQVNNRDALGMKVPKLRAVFERYPNNNPKPLKTASIFLMLSLVGLIVSGLGAIFFAPLTVLAALWANRNPLKRGERLTSLIMIGFALIIWLAGLFLGWLFLSHFSGYSSAA